jgi:hypothetical protein
MTDFDRLERTLQQALWLGAAAVGVLFAVTLASLWFAAGMVGAARDAASRSPVVVVPGAVGGTYTPGLAEETIRGVARYVVGLATSFSGSHGFDVRFDELESFAAARYLPRLQAARRTLRREVDNQNQARTFVANPETERMAQVEPGVFDYTVRGERSVYASGLLLDAWQSTITARMRVAAPSGGNRTGVALENFEVVDAPRAAAASTTAVAAR